MNKLKAKEGTFMIAMKVTGWIQGDYGLHGYEDEYTWTHIPTGWALLSAECDSEYALQILSIFSEEMPQYLEGLSDGYKMKEQLSLENRKNAKDVIKRIINLYDLIPIEKPTS